MIAIASGAHGRSALVGFALVGILEVGLPSTAGAKLAPEIVKALATSKYVYIASERKGGVFGTPAEIWFMFDDGAVWVASPPTTWRVRRLRQGRTRAKIAVGKRDGPSFFAKGSIAKDPTVYKKLFTTFAEKYPEGWPKFEQRFREGLRDGSRVVIKYQPVE